MSIVLANMVTIFCAEEGADATIFNDTVLTFLRKLAKPNRAPKGIPEAVRLLISPYLSGLLNLYELDSKKSINLSFSKWKKTNIPSFIYDLKMYYNPQNSRINASYRDSPLFYPRESFMLYMSRRNYYESDLLSWKASVE